MPIFIFKRKYIHIYTFCEGFLKYRMPSRGASFFFTKKLSWIEWNSQDLIDSRIVELP